ncbi:flagellar biogenesis protein FliO [Chryseobacterium koreense]|nr:flagellar biogenesis protein FliO [Chryseobacterium koreense]
MLFTLTFFVYLGYTFKKLKQDFNEIKNFPINIF